MHPLTVDELRRLMAQQAPPCISIYLPTRRGGSHEDKKRYEGLVRRARELVHSNLSTSAVSELIDPLNELASLPLSADALEGLAVFRSTDTLLYYRLPASVPELTLVAESFHIRPLLAFLQTNRNYYLLNLSQNHVAFFKGNASGLAPVDLRGLPNSLTDALGIEARERSVSYHFGARGGQNPIYGGISKSDTSRDEDLARFYRAIDRALWEVLRDEKVPLVLAAAERSNAMYRTISRYSHLAAEGLVGNFARTSATELHERAWPIVQQEVAARELDVLDRYQSLVSRARALDEVRAIAKFAVQGRVRELLLAKDSYQWGTLDKSTGAVAFHGEPEAAHDDDVLDDIAESVLLRGGEVYSLAKDHMPSKSSVAATLRW
jgi:hypothetical protein